MKQILQLSASLLFALFLAGCYASVGPDPEYATSGSVTAGGCYLNGVWYADCYQLETGYFRYYVPGHNRWYYHRGPGQWYRHHNPPPVYRPAPPPGYHRPLPPTHYRPAPPPPGYHRPAPIPPPRRYAPSPSPSPGVHRGPPAGHWRR